MKWQVSYAVEEKNGKRKEHTEILEARSVREAAMLAHSVIVRPFKSQKKTVTILGLKVMEPA